MILVFQRRIFTARSFREVLAAAGFTLTLLAPMHLEAQRIYEPREVAMLPAYCKYTQNFRERVPGGNNPAEIERWTTLMGSTFIHMHHYCWGLMNTNRALYLARTKRDRMFDLNNSILEFDYVIRNATPNFVMLPEILTKKGENLIRLGRSPHGMLELRRAIDLKPDYWPPYAYLSDYYKEIGDLAQAREWLEKGLSVTPDVKALKSRLAKLERAEDKRPRNGPRPRLRRDRRPKGPPRNRTRNRRTRSRPPIRRGES
jgi:tetratricopeptide (TPR) repeat protein